MQIAEIFKYVQTLDVDFIPGFESPRALIRLASACFLKSSRTFKSLAFHWSKTLIY